MGRGASDFAAPLIVLSLNLYVVVEVVFVVVGVAVSVVSDELCFCHHYFCCQKS